MSLSINWVERGELEKAYTEVSQLLKRRPENGAAHFALSYVLRYAGLLKEAQHDDASLALGPGNYGLRSCSMAFSLDGQYSRGMEYVALTLVRIGRIAPKWVVSSGKAEMLRRWRRLAQLRMIPECN